MPEPTFNALFRLIKITNKLSTKKKRVKCLNHKNVSSNETGTLCVSCAERYLFEARDLFRKNRINRNFGINSDYYSNISELNYEARALLQIHVLIS